MVAQRSARAMGSGFGHADVVGRDKGVGVFLIAIAMPHEVEEPVLCPHGHGGLEDGPPFWWVAN